MTVGYPRCLINGSYCYSIIIINIKVSYKLFNGFPTATPETNLFPFLLTSAGNFLLAFLDSISVLNTATNFAFDLDFTYIHVLALCDNPWTLSSPPATLIRSETGRELTVLDLVSCSDPSEVFSCHIQSAWEVLQTADAFRGHLLGAGKGKWSRLTEWSLGGKVKGRLAYTAGKSAVKSCCQ